MNRSSLAAAAVVVMMVASVGTADAGGQAGSFGVGAEYGLAFGSTGATGAALGLGGASVNYDGGMFHAGGFLGMSDGGGNNDTNYSLGGRFYYHLHSTAMADFGIGGTLGLISLETPADRASLVYLEPSIQIRLFVASNVALSFSTGISIGVSDDADGYDLAGQTVGSAGIHYYFF